MAIPELNKPQDSWCRHCAIGKGCKIYGSHPTLCKGFQCGYLCMPFVGDHWLPARSKMVIVSELDGNRLAIHVDTGRPNAWKQEPYFSEIREWAVLAAEDSIQVVVCLRNHAIVILPGEEVDLGPVEHDEIIFSAKQMTPSGPRWFALKLKTNDPRLAGLQSGQSFGGSQFGLG